MCFRKARGRTSEIWAADFTECSKLNEPFCGSMKDKNAESRVDFGGLVCEISERSLRVPPLRDSLGATCCYFELRVCGSVEVGLKTVINKIAEAPE